MSANITEFVSLDSFPRAILHIDCDAFFTSVEQALNPELKGKPVVTGKERAIVACASYEAKALGVKRPMSLWEARKMLPSLICLPSDYETYSLFSKRVFGIIRRFTPDVEEYSVDEAFADITGLRKMYRCSYEQIARNIKDQIQKELGITVSIGLSPSKTLAKLASKERKPNGFLAVPGRNLHIFLKTMPLDRVCGFGPNTTAFLRKNGLRYCLDYVKRPEAWARKHLGKTGVELWHELRGEAVYPITTEDKRKFLTISKTKTFTPATSDRNFVWAQLVRNLESAFIRLRRHRLRARRVAIYLRTQEFRGSGMEAELEQYTPSTLAVTSVVEKLFNRTFNPKELYRATSIILSDIEADVDLQYTLFDDTAKIQEFKALDKVIDSANELYGKHALSLGTGLWLGKHRQHQNERGDVPARKGDLLKGETARQRLHVPVWNIIV